MRKKWYWYLDPYVLTEELDLTGHGYIPNFLIVAGFLLILYIFIPFAFTLTIDTLFLTSPVWLFVGGTFLFRKLWLNYVQTKTFLDTPRTVMEVRIPREVAKSPAAMEAVSNVFFHTGVPETLYDEYVRGNMRPQFSLEVASFGGQVRFYIQAPTKNKEIVKAQIYSQYPGVEIYEVDDYICRFHFDPEEMELLGIEMTLREPDPYPIKTYVDFGLDKDPKVEYQVDPIAGVLEFLGSVGPGEFIFLQIVVRSHQPDKRPKGWWYNPKLWIKKDGIKKLDWKAAAKEETDKIIKKLETEVKGNSGSFKFQRAPTEAEKMLIESIGRNTAKKPFDTGIRVMYMADKKHFKTERNAGLPTMFRQFESHSLNGFKPRFPTGFVYKSHDPLGRRRVLRKERFFSAFRTRSFFTAPYHTPYFVLSSEELATLYHFPSRATAAPGLDRVAATKAEAPANLPVQ